MPIPHLAVPFRFNVDGTAQVVAQDSLDDITQCVQVLCSTHVGSRLELPGYGVPDQTFAQGPPMAQPVVTAINAWEPRARVSVTSTAGPDASLSVAVSTQPPGGTT